MRVITSEEETASAEEQFAEAIRARGRRSEIVSIGYQSNHFDTRVFWLQDLGYWAYFGLPPNEKSSGKRYWNVFGIEEPIGSVSIACEINPPLSDTNRRAAGIFLMDDSGQVHVAHRGILNARGRIEKDFVFSQFKGGKLSINDAGRQTRVLHVGQLGDTRFPESLRDFITEAMRVKDVARARRGG